jgi:hypothetical protein
MASQKHRNPSEQGKSGYETRDVNILKIVGVGLVSVVLLAIILIALREFFIATTKKQYYEVVLKPESEALKKSRERENEILSSYKVIDQEKGIYRIPIDSAISIMVDETVRLSKQNK